MLWNGSPRTTTFVDNAHLSVAIAAAALATAKVITLTSQNPGSGASNSLTVTVEEKTLKAKGAAAGSVTLSLFIRVLHSPFDKHQAGQNVPSSPATAFTHKNYFVDTLLRPRYCRFITPKNNFSRY